MREQVPRLADVDVLFEEMAPGLRSGLPFSMTRQRVA